MLKIISLFAVRCITVLFQHAVYETEPVALPSQDEWHLTGRVELRNSHDLWIAVFPGQPGGGRGQPFGLTPKENPLYSWSMSGSLNDSSQNSCSSTSPRGRYS